MKTNPSKPLKAEKLFKYGSYLLQRLDGLFLHLKIQNKHNKIQGFICTNIPKAILRIITYGKDYDEVNQYLTNFQVMHYDIIAPFSSK